MNYKEYLENVNKFKETGWMKSQMALKKKPNFWTIIEYGKTTTKNEKSSHEIRYSKMLRWLFDANENHNLGNIFAEKLIKSTYEDSNYDYNLDKEKNRNIKSTSETVGYIDVLYEDLDQRTYMAIEVKQYAKEDIDKDNNSQLDRYQKVTEGLINKNGDDIRPYYIYLTPKGDKPSNKNWKPVCYETLINIIEEVNETYVSNSKDRYKKETQKIILDFKDDLQRTIDFIDADKETESIRKLFKEEQIKFTSTLADEIIAEVESKHMDKLIELEGDNRKEMEKVILILSKYMKVQKQDHTENPAVQIIMRKLFNIMALDKKLSLDLNRSYSAVEERRARLKPEYIKKYGSNLQEVELTSKGQALKLLDTIRGRQIYLSGGRKGQFPSAKIHISSEQETSSPQISGKLPNGTFQIKHDLTDKDAVILKEGRAITPKDLLDKHIMNDVKILNKELSKL